MRADIAERGRTEQRIANGMQEHVAVGMRANASGMGDLHSAERHEVAIREGVHVEALADSKLSHRCPRAARMRAARSRSGAVVILRLSASPSTSRARNPNISDRKSTRLNSSHVKISYAVFC